MKCITVKEMRALEEKHDKYVLMENAGKAVAEEVKKIGKSPILILCGSGNNGGDGLVAARLLDCKVFALESKKEEAQKAREKLGKELLSLEEALEEVDRAAVVVDALLGTGVAGKLREPIRSLVERVNKSSAVVVSIDVPTGVDPDTSRVNDVAVRCDVVVALHACKAGLANWNNVVVKDIGIL